MGCPAEHYTPSSRAYQGLQVLEYPFHDKAIDVETMTAKQMSFFKTKLKAVSRELYLEQGWTMPRGLENAAERNPTNFTLAEWQQANRTFQMLANRGLIEAAEVSVSKSKPTQGFEVLEDADLAELSFEQIIVDHPEEFSPRALWFARHTLGLSNESDKPPASNKLITQIRTETLIYWLRQRTAERGGNLAGYTNADAGAVLGFSDLSTHGRVLGNITSRIDFACYRCGLPPLGLVAETPFANAWNREDRRWAFPVGDMAQAAKTKRWSDDDLKRVETKTLELPGTASISWKREVRENERAVRDWAFSLQASNQGNLGEAEPNPLGDEVADMADLERQALGEKPKANSR